MRNRLTTEGPNTRTAELDLMSTKELIEVMNEEDASVAKAVRRVFPDIEAAVERIIARLRIGGRIIYIGAGTSGRIATLDAAECPPTFGVGSGEVVALVAGGDAALFETVEGAEDDTDAASVDLTDIGLTRDDVVIGIAASGRTPYVLAGLIHAKAVGAETIAVSCNRDALISREAQVAIEVETGPEILTGSTRLKAGTAQKMICNMLSTASMVGTGKVYGNLMVDVRPTNLKLVERSRAIVMEATGCDEPTAVAALTKTNGVPKQAIVMLLGDIDAEEAGERLRLAGGSVRSALSGKE